MRERYSQTPCHCCWQTAPGPGCSSRVEAAGRHGPCEVDTGSRSMGPSPSENQRSHFPQGCPDSQHRKTCRTKEGRITLDPTHSDYYSLQLMPSWWRCESTVTPFWSQGYAGSLNMFLSGWISLLCLMVEICIENKFHHVGCVVNKKNENWNQNQEAGPDLQQLSCPHRMTSRP